ncbi:MAG: hypothetical protein HC769_36320 [Cyanobacteria bacterium CRU_2_1]|nr:hypothetical protein [Cyanobacteria bacterium CRU_2_1]
MSTMGVSARVWCPSSGCGGDRRRAQANNRSATDGRQPLGVEAKQRAAVDCDR